MRMWFFPLNLLGATSLHAFMNWELTEEEYFVRGVSWIHSYERIARNEQAWGGFIEAVPSHTLFFLESSAD